MTRLILVLKFVRGCSYGVILYVPIWSGQGVRYGRDALSKHDFEPTPQPPAYDTRAYAVAGIRGTDTQGTKLESDVASLRTQAAVKLTCWCLPFVPSLTHASSLRPHDIGPHLDSQFPDVLRSIERWVVCTGCPGEGTHRVSTQTLSLGCGA